MADSYSKKLVRVAGNGGDRLTRREMNYFLGISERTAGSRDISMNIVEVPPGAKPAPHRHIGFEVAIYLIQGKVENRFGEGLTESVVTEAGDFLYIPPGVPHQPINLSDTETAVAVIARTFAGENEPQEPYTP